MWPFKWKLSACTFTWCHLFLKIFENEIWNFGRNLRLATFGSERVKGRLHNSLLQFYWNENLLLLSSTTTKTKRYMHWSLDNSHRNHINRILLKTSYWSLHPTGCMSWIILCSLGFLCVGDTGCRGNKITAILIRNVRIYLCELTVTLLCTLHST